MNRNGNRVAFARRYIDNLCRVVRDVALGDLARAIETLEKAVAERRQIFLAGNGGSAATASHMANDLMRGVGKRRDLGVRAIALSDNVPLITAIANDENYDEVFAAQLAVLGRQGDVLIVFSGSGNSPNIVRVAAVARRMQIATIAFLGMDGGQVAKIADVSVIVPSDEYGPIEDVHVMFDHLVTACLRSWLAGTPGMQASGGRLREPSPT